MVKARSKGKVQTAEAAATILSRSFLRWWGYLHVNGTTHTKKYFGPQDIIDARESDFVVRVTGPFNALSRDEAELKVRRELK